MNELFGAFGAQVESKNGHIDVQQADHDMGMDVNSRRANLDGVDTTMSEAPVYVGGKIYVPLRFLCQAFGAKVSWNKNAQQADIQWDGPDVMTFRPAVAIDFPKGADTDEETVIQMVKKSIKAIADKDKSAFRATMEKDVDYLDFLIDTDAQYRFTQLHHIEPYDKSTGRKNIVLGFYYLKAGIIKHGNYTFTSLKNKDGKWYIANID